MMLDRGVTLSIAVRWVEAHIRQCREAMFFATMNLKNSARWADIFEGIEHNFYNLGYFLWVLGD